MPLDNTSDRTGPTPTKRDPTTTSGETNDSRSFSLLGARPKLDDFERRREQMRARLLAVDPAKLEYSTPELLDKPDVPTNIGRYRVECTIGSGGMGVVYRAVDGALERKLAIKLIRGAQQASPTEKARLVQEARAMARLSHPNVVTVHEVGEHEGQLFIAMEYVKGCSLTQWLEARHRPWTQILSMMLGAGKGLAAAHAAGIVHRDFKPDNILVGDDGRPRVADFGLAWTSAPQSAQFETTEQTPVRDGSASAQICQTRTGTILGTLAYMAPEQYRGAQPSFAADQFSFCVALYRALYGHLPYDAASSTLYQARVRTRDVRPPAAGTKVTKSIRSAILRGLSPRPQERWPSLEALLEVLQHRSRPTRWFPAALAVIGLAAVFGVATSMADDNPRGGDSCPPLAEVFAGNWDDAAQQRLQQKFEHATTKSALAWRTVKASLDQYNDRWSLEYSKACHERRTSTDAELVEVEHRLACLRIERETFTELVSRIGSEQVDDVDAMLAASGLPSPELCQSAPTDVKPRSRVWKQQQLRVRKLLARSTVDIDLHRLDAARSSIHDALQLAQELADPGLEAEARLALGRAQRAGGNHQAARSELVHARQLVREHPMYRALELRILIQLIDVIGTQPKELTHAEHLYEEATALSQQLGRPTLLEAYLANNFARVLRVHGRDQAATAGYLNAYTLLRQSLGDSAPETIAVRVNLGVVQSRQGQPEAVAVLRQALEQQLSVVGEYHPRTPSILRNLGNALDRTGDYAGAANMMRRAAHLRQQLHGEQSPALIGDLIGLARALRGLRRFDEANQALLRAEHHKGLEFSQQQSLQRERSALERAIAAAPKTSP